MRRTWEWLGLNLGKHAGVVACIGLAITIVLGFGLTSVRLTTGDSDYLNGNDPLAIGNQEYTSLFGGDPIAVLFTMKPGTTVDDLLTPANQVELRHVDQELAKNPTIYNFVSPLTALDFASKIQSGKDLAAQMFISAYERDPSPRSRAARSAYAVAEARQLGSFSPSQRVSSNPKWLHFVLHEPDGSLRTVIQAFVPDERHILMAVFLKPNLDFNQELAAAASVEQITGSAHYQNATTITTGVPEIEKEVNDYVRSALRTLILLAALLMALILAVAFRVRWRLLPFAVLGVGMIWAFGLVGYFGIPLSFATLTAIPVLMGVGMDYSIQMHARIEEEVRVNRAGHPIQAAARGLGPALLIVTFDAVSAILSGNALLMTFIGGVGVFWGPILGAVLITLLQSWMSLISNAWLIYVALLFIVMVIYAPGGVAGVVMAHVPIWRAGRLSGLAVPYMRILPPALIGAGGFVALVELTYFVTIGSGQGKTLNVLHHEISTSSPTPWLLASAFFALGTAVASSQRRAFKIAWDELNEHLQAEERG